MENTNCSDKKYEICEPIYPKSPMEIAAQASVKAMADMFSQSNYEILTANSKEEVLKKLKNFKKKHKISNVSFSTNTKYSKIFDGEYTEYNILVQYI